MSLYPRTCTLCSRTYSDKTGFCKHTSRGTCKRRQNANPQQSAMKPHVKALQTPVDVRTVRDYEREIRILQERLSALSPSNLPLSRCGYIYIIRKFSPITGDLPYYKVGTTDDITARLRQYEKGSELMHVIRCENHRLIEQRLHNALALNFKRCVEQGRETYEADFFQLRSFINEFCEP